MKVRGLKGEPSEIWKVSVAIKRDLFAVQAHNCGESARQLALRDLIPSHVRVEENSKIGHEFSI